MSTLRKFRNLNLLFADGDGAEAGTSGSTETTGTGDATAGEGQEGSETTTSDTTGQESASSTETFDRAYVEKLRRENAAAREKAKTDAAAAADAAKTELAQSIGKALGLVKDEEVTVDTLTSAVSERDQTITTQSSELKTLRIENRLLRGADKFDADLDALLDSRAFAAKADALDPGSDDFDSQVESLVKETVASNPSKFKRVQVAASTGSTQHTGESTTGAGESDSIDDIRTERQKRRGMG